MPGWFSTKAWRTEWNSAHYIRLLVFNGFIKFLKRQVQSLVFNSFSFHFAAFSFWISLCTRRIHIQKRINVNFWWMRFLCKWENIIWNLVEIPFEKAINAIIKANRICYLLGKKILFSLQLTVNYGVSPTVHRFNVHSLGYSHGHSSVSIYFNLTLKWEWSGNFVKYIYNWIVMGRSVVWRQNLYSKRVGHFVSRMLCLSYI